MYTIATMEYEDGNIVPTDVICTPCIGEAIKTARKVIGSPNKYLAYVLISNETTKHRIYNGRKKLLY